MSEQDLGAFKLRYMDRQSKKSGILVRRDPQNRCVILADDNGQEFTVNESTFRNYWRKVDTEPVEESEEKKVETTQGEVKAEEKKSTRKERTTVEIKLTEEEKQNVRDLLAWRKANIKGSNNEELEELVKSFDNN